MFLKKGYSNQIIKAFKAKESESCSAKCIYEILYKKIYSYVKGLILNHPPKSSIIINYFDKVFISLDISFLM